MKRAPDDLLARLQELGASERVINHARHALRVERALLTITALKVVLVIAGLGVVAYCAAGLSGWL